MNDYFTDEELYHLIDFVKNDTESALNGEKRVLSDSQVLEVVKFNIKLLEKIEELLS